MSYSLVPIHVKPHLVPFVFKYFPCEEEIINGEKVKTAKLLMHTAFGKILRSLFTKSITKVRCDKNSQIILKVVDKPDGNHSLKTNLKFADGRSSFLTLDVAYVELFNTHLEEQMELAMYYYIYSWYQKEGKDGIDSAIINFLQEYNLEDYGNSPVNIRRTFYRKLKAGFFKATVSVNTLNGKLI